MTQIMNASEVKLMTDGQIDTAVNQLRDALRKHRSETSSDVAQQVLGTDNLGMLMFAPFRELAEMISKMVIRHVPVNRARKPQEVLDATGRRQYTDRKVVDSMPKGEGDEAEVVFFQVGRYVSNDDLQKEYDLRGLKPVDPYALASVNEADPAFADQKPNGSQWKDADGKWCFVTFGRWRGGERDVSVDRFGSDDGWSGSWWFGGVRK